MLHGNHGVEWINVYIFWARLEGLLLIEAGPIVQVELMTKMTHWDCVKREGIELVWRMANTFAVCDRYLSESNDIYPLVFKDFKLCGT
jgi:hypothetical protein